MAWLRIHSCDHCRRNWNVGRYAATPVVNNWGCIALTCSQDNIWDSVCLPFCVRCSARNISMTWRCRINLLNNGLRYGNVCRASQLVLLTRASFSILDLLLISLTLRNTEALFELTFSTFIVGIGELRPEGRFRASCASEKTSSSASDASEATVSRCFMNLRTWKFERRNYAPRSCAPGSSSSTLLRGGIRVGLLGG